MRTSRVNVLIGRTRPCMEVKRDFEKALEENIIGKRPRSRPSHRWVDGVDDDLNKSAQEVTVSDSLERDVWRNVAEAAKVFREL